MTRTFVILLTFIASSSLFAQDTARFVGGQSDDVMRTIYSPDGKYIVTGGWNGELYIYINDSVPYYYLSFQDFMSSVTSMAFSRDSRMLVVGGFNGEIMQYYFPHDSMMDYIRLDTSYTFGKSPVNDLEIGPTGRMIYAANDAGVLTTLDLKKKEIKEVKAAGPIQTFAVSMDRRNYFVGTKGSSDIIQYNIFGKEVKRFVGHQGEVTGLAVTLDRKKLISCSNDKSVKIWDLKKAEVIISLSHHNWDITGMATDPFTRYVATCGLDGLVNIYQVGNGKLLKQYKNTNGRCTDIAFSPGLRWVMVGLHMEQTDNEGHGVNLWPTGLEPPRPKGKRPPRPERVRKEAPKAQTEAAKPDEKPQKVIHKSEQVEISIEE